MSDLLLPCPHCNGHARMERETDLDGARWIYVRCAGCNARTGGNWVQAGNECPQLYQEERDRWNRRAAAPAQAAPPGWKLVPVEPTEYMTYAGEDAIVGLAIDTEAAQANNCYRAMLAAVPPQPSPAPWKAADGQDIKRALTDMLRFYGIKPTLAIDFVNELEQNGWALQEVAAPPPDRNPKELGESKKNQKNSGPDLSGELWSLIRKVLTQGHAQQQDYADGKHAGYEAFSARVDLAARERVPQFLALFYEEVPSPDAVPLTTEDDQ